MGHRQTQIDTHTVHKPKHNNPVSPINLQRFGLLEGTGATEWKEHEHGGDRKIAIQIGLRPSCLGIEPKSRRTLFWKFSSTVSSKNVVLSLYFCIISKYIFSFWGFVFTSDCQAILKSRIIDCFWSRMLTCLCISRYYLGKHDPHTLPNPRREWDPRLGWSPVSGRPSREPSRPGLPHWSVDISAQLRLCGLRPGPLRRRPE